MRHKLLALNLGSRFVLFLLLLGMFTGSLSHSFAAEKRSPISRSELKHLLKVAKEPSEHRRIAEYYRQQAQRLIARSKDHEEMGEIYKRNPLPFEGKYPYGAVGLSHCRYWADLERKEAKEAEALAVLQEKMANAAEQKH